MYLYITHTKKRFVRKTKSYYYLFTNYLYFTKIDEVGDGYWSTQGCWTSLNSHDNVVVCRCNHLTNFAVLLNVYQEEEEVLLSQDALNVVSLIGCIASIFSLAATLVAYLSTK